MDAGATMTATTATSKTPSLPPMTTPFEDNFDRPNAAGSAVVDAGDWLAADAQATGDGAPNALSALQKTGALAKPVNPLGPDWYIAQTTAWRIENGRLCAENAHNHGVWLKRTLPVNARIEFDAIAETAEGDLKAEIWGDGQSAATSISYTNATSYLTILGGWHNKFHVLARLNEHGGDRKEIRVDKESDDPRQHPTNVGQIYHFKVERTDGKTVRWSVDGVEYLSYPDSEPLAGAGHDHFGFNNWESKVCFDNVHVTPL